MSESEAPLPGQVVGHHFLWSGEWQSGRVEGSKPRPCLIIAVERFAGRQRVTVLPITSRKPDTRTPAIAIPPEVKQRIGLDRGRDAWVVLDEANAFAWPGFDLIPKPGGGFVRGVVTRGFYRTVREAVLKQHPRGRVVDRD